MKITVEKDFLEKNFPFRLQEFSQINGFYQKTVYQDQLEIEFEDQDCKYPKMSLIIYSTYLIIMWRRYLYKIIHDI